MNQEQIRGVDEADRLMDLAERWLGEMLMKFTAAECQKYQQTTNHVLNALDKARSHLSPMVPIGMQEATNDR